MDLLVSGAGAETERKEEVTDISEGGNVQDIAKPKVWITESRRCRTRVRVRRFWMNSGSCISVATTS